MEKDAINGGTSVEDVNGGERSNNSTDDSSPRRKLLARLNLQGGDSSTSGENSPLGLKLTKTPSFIDLLRKKLNHEAEHNPSHDNSQPQSNDFALRTESEKRKNKATNFPAKSIRIGSWTRNSIYEGDLVAKCYFAKKKLVWELLNGPLKSKIEIVWDDICAMRAFKHCSRMDILEIELIKPPKFYQETAPQPRKHTNWEQSSDFTQGQALLWRRHHIEFSPGTLDKHYENLLQCDNRLFELSQRDFPNQQTQFIYPTIFNCSNNVVVSDPIRAPVPLQMHQQSSFGVPQMQQYQSSSICSHMQYQYASLPLPHLATDLANAISPIEGGFKDEFNMAFQAANEIGACHLENDECVQPLYPAMTVEDHMMSNMYPQGARLGMTGVLDEVEHHTDLHTGLLEQPNIDTTIRYGDPAISYNPRLLQSFPPSDYNMQEIVDHVGPNHIATMTAPAVQPGIGLYDPQPLQSFPATESSMQEIVADDDGPNHRAAIRAGPVFW